MSCRHPCFSSDTGCSLSYTCKQKFDAWIAVARYTYVYVYFTTTMKTTDGEERTVASTAISSSSYASRYYAAMCDSVHCRQDIRVVTQVSCALRLLLLHRDPVAERSGSLFLVSLAACLDVLDEKRARALLDDDKSREECFCLAELLLDLTGHLIVTNGAARHSR